MRKLNKILIGVIAFWVAITLLFTVLHNQCNIYSKYDLVNKAVGIWVKSDKSQPIARQEISGNRILLASVLSDNGMPEKRDTLFSMNIELPLGFIKRTWIKEQEFTPYDLTDVVLGLQFFRKKEEVHQFSSQDEEIAETDLESSIRKLMNTWLNNPENKKFLLFFTSQGIEHQEDMLSIMLVSTYRKLNGLELYLEIQIEYITDYWKTRPSEIIESTDFDQIVEVLLQLHFLPNPAVLLNETRPFKYMEKQGEVDSSSEVESSIFSPDIYYREYFDELIQTGIIDTTDADYMIKAIHLSKVYAIHSNKSISVKQYYKIYSTEFLEYLENKYQANGLILLGTPLFNQNSTKAIITADQSGYRDGAGYRFVLAKSNGKWEVIYVERTWIRIS